MASGQGVVEELAWILNCLKCCDKRNLSTCLNGKVSLLPLVYPLLPPLPSQPSPTLLAQLLRETTRETRATSKEDKCDMCGRVGKNFVTCCWAPTALSKKELSHQVLQKRSSLDRMMEVIEEKFNETLNSIEQTTVRCDALNKQRKELNETPVMTDAELLHRLQSLFKEKKVLEERVKALENQEQQIKETLISEFELLKPLHRGQNLPDSEGIDQINEGEQMSADQRQHPSQEGIINENLNVSTPKNNETMDLQEFMEKGDEDVSHHQETVKENKFSKVTLDQQFLTENRKSEDNLNLENIVQGSYSESEIIITNYISSSKEELNERS